MIGQTISHYKITEKLGEGGMGVVYKAEDTSLDRPVALKFLAAHLVSDEDVRKRFEREAKAAAALNHPNICTVYEIAEDNARTFIAMAFLEGEGLDKKIEAGPLKLKDALDIAIQTAKGLQAAHGKGIVHRDIKPANLMVGPDGHVIIMDFGLAQLADRSKLTRMDETMGTVTYMSPEQTYGADIDHRSDIWSLGVVIYEMVVGEQPFKGHYDKAVMYSITNEEPEPITALRTGLPMELEVLVNKCLAKAADRRYQSAAELLVDLETLSDKLKSGKSAIRRTAAVTGAHAGPTHAAGQTNSSSLPHPLMKYRVIEDLEGQDDGVVYRAEDTELHRSVAIRILPESDAQKAQARARRRHLLSTAVFLLVIGLAAIFGFLLWNQPLPEVSLRRFSFTPDSLSNPDIVLGGAMAISPDGKRIVYAAGGVETKLWIRDLADEEARELDGTEGARDPFWSPDSQFIGFVTEIELKKISLGGGAPITLCELPHRAFSGGTWSPDGDSIVFSSDFPMRLFQVSAHGGTSEILFEPEESMGPHYLTPHFLPAEAATPGIVFSVGNRSEPKLVIRNLQTGKNDLMEEGGWPSYSDSGHLVFERDNDVWALPLSLASLRATGEAFPVARNAQGPSVARDGTLAYTDAASADRQLVWRSRTGEKLEVVGHPQGMAKPSLSPDGRYVTVQSEGRASDVWVHEITRGSRTRITSNAGSFQPAWTPSGEQVTYSSFRGGLTDIFSVSADGSGEETQLTDGPLSEYDPHWSPDGRHLIYHTLGDPKMQRDLWYQEIEPGGGISEPVLFAQTSYNERNGRFSPDGDFVAYCSDRSGRYEVYVRPFPEGGPVTAVSAGGGCQPQWGKKGKELFFVEGTTLMSAPVSTGGVFSADLPKPLFGSAGLLAGIGLRAEYDVSDDGQRFLLVETVGDEAGKPRSIRVVQNWYEEFREREQD